MPELTWGETLTAQGKGNQAPLYESRRPRPHIH